MLQKFFKSLFRVYNVMMFLFLIAIQHSLRAQTGYDTLLNINYENGQLNSGIPGVVATGATATDAAYLVNSSFGAMGNYSIAHKVIPGDTDYESDGAPRSESDAMTVQNGRFFPGEEKRYEFSIMLKGDWPTSDLGEEINLFQTKITGPPYVPIMVKTNKTGIRLRFANTKIGLAVSDYRPYVNQWIHFRIDVLWTTDTMGYIKVYTKLPDEMTYTLKTEQKNLRTFTGDNAAAGQFGYIKWGIYSHSITATRIVLHDNVRIINLKPPAIGNIWCNPIEGAFNFTNPVIGGKTDSHILNNNTTPSFHFSVGTLTPSNGTFSGRVSVSDWITGNVTIPSSFNNTEYFEFKLEPENGYQINFSQFNFNYRLGSTTGSPNIFTMRSSIDNYNTDIAAPVNILRTTGSTLTSYDLSALQNIDKPITIRLYWYNNLNSGGTVGIDNFTFTGSVFHAQTNLSSTDFATISANYSKGNLLVNWKVSTEKNDGYFEIQSSRDGKYFTTIKTIKAKSRGSSITQNYAISMIAKDLEKLLNLPLIFGLLVIGKRFRYSKTMLLAYLALTITSLLSCVKNTENLISDNSSRFIRIKQVDSEARVKYSNIVSVRMDN